MVIISLRAAARTLVVAGALAATVAATPVLAQEPKVLATVNGRPITETDVKVAMEMFGEQVMQIPEAERTTMIVDALVDMRIFSDAALAAGLDQSEVYKQRLDFLSSQALRNTFIEEKVQKAVTEEELKARYEKDVAAYTPPEEVHARHILVEDEATAKQIIADLAAGGSFEAIAKEKSTDPGSKDNGGDLGFFTKGQMVPEFETEAFTLAVGETSKAPVKTQFGFHIINVVEKRTQPVPTFEEVRAQVVPVVEREKYEAVMAELKAAAKVERFDAPPAPAGEPAEGETAEPAEGEGQQ